MKLGRGYWTHRNLLRFSEILIVALDNNDNAAYSRLDCIFNESLKGNEDWIVLIASQTSLSLSFDSWNYTGYSK